ncbi:hypothetical protein THARTR1_09692 [Trichoderma harzianum]|uniref:Uncharacterized protein n=1 Tax=Trichoderma harzianum TaxID=5544 RepID=A0A2K0TV14_TRIHA|nr:hypothetical protein THARTR1_09692 [Trichoderma harzianum]
MEARWSNVQQAAKIFEQHKFDCIVLPRQTLFKVQTNRETHLVIAEERLPMTANSLVHKQLYESLGARLDPTLRQLVAFVIASGFRNVDYKNIKIPDQELAPGANPRIGLVDVDGCGEVQGEAGEETYEKSFFGEGWRMRGLLRCIAPEQFEVVKAEALKHQVTFNEGDYYEAWKDRCHQFAEDCRNRELVSNSAVYRKYSQEHL